MNPFIVPFDVEAYRRQLEWEEEFIVEPVLEQTPKKRKKKHFKRDNAFRNRNGQNYKQAGGGTFPAASFSLSMDHQNQQTPTKLEYYEEMSKLQSKATLLSTSLGEDGRIALILDSTIFYPQGGGQPYDTGFISNPSSLSNFIVQDVRSKNGIVFHYGVFEKSDSKLEEGTEVMLSVDESRRKINTRLHSAGHLLDICMKNVGLGHLEPGKSYHFPEGPYVEYIGAVPLSEWETKRNELELEANKLISEGGKVSVAILPYDKASELCDGCLPDYIPKGSTPRIIKLGDYPGCPCGGTHVSDFSELSSMKITQIRTKKGLTKVFYNIGS